MLVFVNSFLYINLFIQLSIEISRQPSYLFSIQPHKHLYLVFKLAWWIASGFVRVHRPLLLISALICLWILPCRKFIGPKSVWACMNWRSCSVGMNSSIGRAPSASKHAFIIVHHHCARSWLFLDSNLFIDLSVSWRVFFALAKFHENTCSKFSFESHMGHFGLELKYLCILVAVAHSLLMNFSTGTSLAKFSWLIESTSRSHATVASFSLVIPMCF